ncbi:NADPH:quinone oxidoreductase family protein [Limibacillus halophilus]|uniref:NADPH2:quinone reductase n=1 Tax=Limibacillus halophilus TaxID=1579333 RepID=A0A839SVN3_9PROT|nr:NADPH:quinone oxidoreductase family protein [Limibacillus halophilus]MBB3066358.1 NADPH2:quinone reductase [Limibacillus halophilus]
MRAVICDSWGEPESLKVGQLPEPRPGAGDVLIRVAAAGLNFADTLMIAGKYQEKPPFPFSPGLEVAGEVLEVGEGVSGTKPGDRVLAVVDHGGFAEQAIARESDVFKIPDSLDFQSAAGFPITYGTAHGALVWRAGLKAGETLLVHGAAGGVGLAAVEVGKALGARVIASAGGADRCRLAEAHGADASIDYRTDDLRAAVKDMTDGRGVDVVFDPVGGDIFDASLRCLAWSGRLLTIGFAAGRVPQAAANILLVKNISVVGCYWGSYRKQAPEMLRDEFAELFGWYDAGLLKPHVSHALPLEKIAEAMQLLLSRRSTGKVVLTTDA